MAETLSYARCMVLAMEALELASEQTSDSDAAYFAARAQVYATLAVAAATSSGLQR